MGAIAQDFNDGSCCQLCGQYFQDPGNIEMTYTHHIPVVCYDCWDELDKTEKEMYTRAKTNTI